MVTKLEQLKEWAKQNVTLIDLLPNNNGLQVTTRLIDVLEDEVDEKYYLSEEKAKKLTLNTDLSGKLNMYNYNERDKVHSVNKVSPTLNTMQGGDRQPKVAVPVLTPDRLNKRQNGRRFKDDGEPTFTLTAQDRHGIITDDIRIRKLVPIETWRLQGFTDEQFYKAKNSGVSNSQLYKQSGNSVTVNVVDAIVKQLKE